MKELEAALWAERHTFSVAALVVLGLAQHRRARVCVGGGQTRACEVQRIHGRAHADIAVGHIGTTVEVDTLVHQPETKS